MNRLRSSGIFRKVRFGAEVVVRGAAQRSAHFSAWNSEHSTSPRRSDSRQFVPNDALVDTIKTDLTPPLDEAGFTECVVNVTDNDRPGWHRVQVEASPLGNYVLNYDPDEDGDFDRYIRRFLHGSALAPVEEQFHEDDEQSSEPDNAVEEGVASPLAEMYANAEADD